MDARATLGPIAAATRRPIFLHGMWRSGSTYVWSRFRDCNDTLCFYEPLHEGLGRLTRARIHRETSDVGRDLRHPPLDRPYFAEYEPRLDRRGVRLFRPAFARDRIVLGASDRHSRLHDYIASLLAQARAGDRTAVLGFNRTNLRMPWLDRFGAFNLYIERDPEEIWASYMDHAAAGNFSFLKNWLLTLERNRRDPLLAPLAERMPLRRTLSERMRRPKAHYAEAIARMAPQETYLLVRYLWLVSLVQAVAYCHVVLDVSAAARDATLAAGVAKAVRAATGVAVDLSGCASPPARLRLAPEQRQAADDTCLALLPPAALAPLRHAPPASVSLLTPEKQTLLRELRPRYELDRRVQRHTPARAEPRLRPVLTPSLRTGE